MKAGGKNYPAVVAIQSPMALMHFCGDTSGEDAGLGAETGVFAARVAAKVHQRHRRLNSDDGRIILAPCLHWMSA